MIFNPPSYIPEFIFPRLRSEFLLRNTIDNNLDRIFGDSSNNSNTKSNDSIKSDLYINGNTYNTNNNNNNNKNIYNKNNKKDELVFLSNKNSNDNVIK